MSEMQCSSPGSLAERPFSGSVKWIGNATSRLLKYVLLYNLCTYSEGGAALRSDSDLPALYAIESKLNLSQEEKRETQPICFALTSSSGQCNSGGMRWCHTCCHRGTCSH